MAATGILARVLPGADPAPLGPLVHLEAEAGLGPRWQRRLAALGPQPGWAEALRLSRADARALVATAAALAEDARPAAAAYRHGPDAARDAALIRAATLAQPLPADLEAEVARGAAAVLPLSAADLELEGPALGRALKAAEAAWIASDFALTADELRQLTPD
jgi:poly(A) polymerase